MFTDIVPGRPRALMMYIEINVFMPAHTTSILQSMDQGGNSDFQVLLLKYIL